MRHALIAVLPLVLCATAASAQVRPAKVEAAPPRERERTGVMRDPARVDAAHYTVEFEDANIRILRVRLGAGETSVMHEHPRGICIVPVTNEHTRHETPEGVTTETQNAAGSVTCNPMQPGWYRHKPTNLSSAPTEYLVIERKPAGYQRGLQPMEERRKPAN